jgi:hypothetical protein
MQDANWRQSQAKKHTQAPARVRLEDLLVVRDAGNLRSTSIGIYGAHCSSVRAVRGAQGYAETRADEPSWDALGEEDADAMPEMPV